jgi:hypothetical protein
MTQAYPLSWPYGVPRSKAPRDKGRLTTDYKTALGNVIRSLKAFGKESGRTIVDPILSSNMNLLESEPADPGVAVWFTWDNIQVCIPVDRYEKPAANLQAIHHILEARRTELRHGTLTLVRASFQGFKALPAPTHWATILKLKPNATRDEIEAAFRRLATERHPDRGGSQNAMAELNDARQRALAETRQ